VAAAVSLVILRQRHAQTLHVIAVTRDIAVLSLSAGISGCSTWLLMSALSASSWQGIRGIFGAIALSAVLFAIYIACTKVLKVDWKSLKALSD
jgi:Na+/proline symporter